MLGIALVLLSVLAHGVLGWNDIVRTRLSGSSTLATVAPSEPAACGRKQLICEKQVSLSDGRAATVHTHLFYDVPTGPFPVREHHGHALPSDGATVPVALVLLELLVGGLGLPLLAYGFALGQRPGRGRRRLDPA